ncbi:MAG: 2-succinyl-5-enolpyruvyl-6-hydroxy-3-cyclohexene-1-carboxylic-acid synthase [Kocuria sp.]|nr:2-succinyl-5-enolpyruvyl-6-hydroxy-3-cyclohexene-1-carboxylic-acid synthase [Kocuria sp.]
MTSSDSQPDAFLTAVSVLDSLIRSGMREVVLAPGSRSAPLAYALAAASEAGVVEVHVRIDERTAGFTALGMAKASGRPVGVVTTSGTAAGELMPAVMEANHSEVPLAILSADRPPRLRGTGANQTTWQQGLYGVHVRASADLVSYPEPEPGGQTVAFTECLAALTGRDPASWDRPSNRPLGPVQINVAFDVPLTPEPRMRETLRAWADSLTDVRAPVAPRRADSTVTEALGDSDPGEALASEGPGAEGVRTVVIAGDGAGPLARMFAEAADLPLLAEPSSGARSGPNAMGTYQLLLDGELGDQIERVVLFGRPTLSRSVDHLLHRGDVESVIYLPRPVAWALPDRRPETPVETLVEARRFAGRPPRSWLEWWHTEDERVDNDLQRALAEARDRNGCLNGPLVARAVREAMTDDGLALVCGSSNLIRDLDLVPVDPRAAHDPMVWSNRGLAGIDGTVATASGIALARREPLRLLLGDLTLLHDAGSLLFGPGEVVPDVQIIVFNDSGGGIFSTLEHGNVAKAEGWAGAVERFFGTPHDADVERLVTAHGHRYMRADDEDALFAALAAPVRGISVIEVRGTREGLTEERAEWKDIVARDSHPGKR